VLLKVSKVENVQDVQKVGWLAYPMFKIALSIFLLAHPMF